MSDEEASGTDAEARRGKKIVNTSEEDNGVDDDQEITTTNARGSPAKVNGHTDEDQEDGSDDEDDGEAPEMYGNLDANPKHA